MESLEKMSLFLELIWAHLCILIKKDILILREGPTKGLDDTTLTSEAKDPINSMQSRKRFELSLQDNGINRFLFVNDTKIYQFKAKNSEIKDYALCLGNISKDFTINNMKKRELKRIENIFFCWFWSYLYQWYFRYL